MSDNIQLTGRIFTEDNVKGYINAVSQILSSGQLSEVLRISAELTTPPSTDLYKLLQKPIALDYAFTALIFEGIKVGFSPQGGPKLTKFMKRVGREWWFPAPPLYPSFWRNTNLLEFITPLLREKVFLKSDILTFNEYFFFIVSVFLEEFEKATHIKGNITKISDQKFKIDFLICPFCLNRSDECYVLFGIVEGFIDWLRGFPDTESYKVYANKFGIITEESGGHNVVVGTFIQESH